MDGYQEEEIHYVMLRYIYNKKKLSISCFNSIWDEFLNENPDFNEKTADQLKTIFWKEVLPNISNYRLLNENEEEYFRAESIAIDPGAFVEGIDPMAGIDFKLCHQGQNDDILEDEAGGNLKKVEDVFKKPNKCDAILKPFANTSDYNTDANCINILKGQAPKFEPAENSLDHELTEVFGVALLNQDDIEGSIFTLPKQEIMMRLMNHKALSRIQIFKRMPIGLQDYLLQFEYFKNLFTRIEPLEVSSFETTIGSQLSAESSSLNVPSICSDGSNKVVVDRRTRSSTAREDLPEVAQRRLAALERIQSQSPSTIGITPRSGRTRKDNLIPQPAVNPRMAEFTRHFNIVKRRRDSSSPEN